MIEDRVSTIHLHGSLGERFGERHEFVAPSVAQATRALCTMIPGFQSALLEDPIGFRVLVNEEEIGVEALRVPVGRGEIHIVPVISGSGRGLGNIIVGAVMVVAAFYTGGASIAAWGASSALMGLSGVAMIASGVSQAMTKTPTGNVEKETSEEKPSYNFNGAINTAAEGAMPVLYGRMKHGSRVISADIYAENIQ